MARTDDKYSKVQWLSFIIPREAWKWLGMFRANYGMDFQAVLALALLVGVDKMPEGAESITSVDWRTAKVQASMHERMKAMALDSGEKLQDIGAALLESAKPVMDDHEKLIEFINGQEWPDGFKLSAQIGNLAEQLGRLVDWEAQGGE